MRAASLGQDRCFVKIVDAIVRTGALGVSQSLAHRDDGDVLALRSDVGASIGLD
jgi:hypothetical protein